MRQIGSDIYADAVKRHPISQADTDRGDLVLAAVGQGDPNADAAAARFPLDVKARESPDQPFLEIADKGARIGLSILQIQHHIADPLSRTMIGVLTAASALESRKARIEKVALLRTRSRRVERQMFEQPDLLGRAPATDRLDALFHQL